MHYISIKLLHKIYVFQFLLFLIFFYSIVIHTQFKKATNTEVSNGKVSQVCHTLFPEIMKVSSLEYAFQSFTVFIPYHVYTLVFIVYTFVQSNFLIFNVLPIFSATCKIIFLISYQYIFFSKVGTFYTNERQVAYITKRERHFSFILLQKKLLLILRDSEPCGYGGVGGAEEEFLTGSRGS